MVFFGWSCVCAVLLVDWILLLRVSSEAFFVVEVVLL
jgi:hypothetical protein